MAATALSTGRPLEGIAVGRSEACPIRNGREAAVRTLRAVRGRARAEGPRGVVAVQLTPQLTPSALSAASGSGATSPLPPRFPDGSAKGSTAAARRAELQQPGDRGQLDAGGAYEGIAKPAALPTGADPSAARKTVAMRWCVVARRTSRASAKRAWVAGVVWCLAADTRQASAPATCGGLLSVLGFTAGDPESA